MALWPPSSEPQNSESLYVAEVIIHLTGAQLHACVPMAAYELHRLAIDGIPYSLVVVYKQWLGHCRTA